MRNGWSWKRPTLRDAGSASTPRAFGQQSAQSRRRRGSGIDLCPELLEAGRIAQRDGYAEAEMVVPDDVLAAATSAFAAGVEESWSQLAVMQEQMRQALGVESRTRGDGTD
ncbi:hypothetical protein ACWGJB_41255 [Streptomyces sp. NPDC054813]